MLKKIGDTVRYTDVCRKTVNKLTLRVLELSSKFTLIDRVLKEYECVGKTALTQVFEVVEETVVCWVTIVRSQESCQIVAQVHSATVSM